MSLREQAARGVFWSAAGNWGYQITTLIVFATLSRLLTPEAFGLVALATVFTALLKLIAEQGLADALVQKPDLEPGDLDTSFWLNVIVGTTLAAALAASSTLIARLVNAPEVAPVLAALSPVLILAAFSSVQRAILARELRFASLTARTLLSVVAGGVVGVVAALVGWGVWSLVAQILTIEAVGVVTLWAASDWRPRARFSRNNVRSLFTFGASVVGYRLLRFLNTRTDNLIVGTVLGATALGFYVVAYRLLQLLIDMTTAIVGAVAFPVFSRIQGDAQKVRTAYYKAIRLTSVLAFPAFLGLVAVAPEATRLVFGPQWDPSVPVIRVLAIAGLLNSILFVNSIVMKSLGKPSWRLVVMALMAGLLVVAYLIVVQHGIVAVAAAFAIVSAVVAPLWVLGAHKLVGLEARRFARQIWPSLLSAAVMTGAVFALKPLVDQLGLLWAVMILVAAGIGTYGAVLWLVGKSLVKEAIGLGKLAIPRRGRRDLSR